MPNPTRTLFALLLALSLMGGWTVQAATSCGGSCCVTETPAPRPMNHNGSMTDEMASGCCCGDEEVPCDLERGNLPAEPPRALAAAPKVETPAAGLLAVNHLVVRSSDTGVSLRCSAADSPGRSPPGPLYLYHLSFLC